MIGLLSSHGYDLPRFQSSISFGLYTACYRILTFEKVLFVFFCSFAMTGVYHGTGQHATALPPAEIPVGLKWWWACEPVYVLSNMALKFSIAIFLLRIAVAKTHKVIIWTCVAVIELYSAFYFFLFVLQCRPSAYFWTQYTGGKGSCINPKITVDATYVYSAISCATDWTLGIIPVFLVDRKSVV